MLRLRGIVGLFALLVIIHPQAWGQSRGHSGGSHRHHGSPPLSPVTINPNPGAPAPHCPIYLPSPPLLIVGGPWYAGPVAPITLPPTAPTLPVGLPLMPPLWQPTPDPWPTIIPPPSVAKAAARPRARDTSRMKELMELGDRLFRAGNYVRAVERYEQARKADPDKAAPRVRLAEVDLVRGKYQDAANKLREAQVVEPGWLANAGTLQEIFPEPADFARLVAKLEAHLQSRPEDRDAWLMLGAAWYLSGRTQKAADVFLRLSDRRPDATLRAFLDATKAERP